MAGACEKRLFSAPRVECGQRQPVETQGGAIAGVGGSAAALEIATGTCTQLGLFLLGCAYKTPSRSVLAVPEGTPSALQAKLLALPPSAMAKLTANLLHFT